MSSGPAHYKEAEALLAMAEEQRIAAAMGDPTAAADSASEVTYLLAAAQVHAALAQTAIDAMHQGVVTGAVHINRVRPWMEAIGIYETGDNGGDA
jgi:hypothetical protein